MWVMTVLELYCCVGHDCPGASLYLYSVAFLSRIAEFSYYSSIHHVRMAAKRRGEERRGEERRGNASIPDGPAAVHSPIRQVMSVCAGFKVVSSSESVHKHSSQVNEV